jgi:hypothetical protein
MGVILMIFVVMASMASLELYILRRYLGRRSLAACILTGAAIGGIFWGVILVTIVFTGARTEASQTISERLLDFGFKLILYVLFMSAVALIASAITAVIYRNLKSEK